MLGKLLLIAPAPFALAYVLARYVADTERDAWLMAGVGIFGSLCILLIAWIDHCMMKGDEKDDAAQS